ncbi:MAG: cyclic nucleotide-binding domain-containing protein [Chloroflexi bacterium]|nr:cyclic nucleotide-binding domain-containing protein [Chloroflexota bacterium]
MSLDITKHLTKYELFEGLPDRVIGELGEKIMLVSLEKNDTLFHQGDPGDALYLIRSGWVKVVKEVAEEGEVVLNHIGPGGIIGEMAMIDHAPRSSGIVAISDVEMLKLKSDDFLNMLNEQPMMTLPIIRSVSKRLRFATTYIENAIEWSKRIAAGNYDFAEEQIQMVQATIVDSKQPDEERANRFLGTFFRMVEEIRAREDELKHQLKQLKVEIDFAKRKQAVDELVGSEFFIELKAKSEQMRNKKPSDGV